MRTPMPRRPTTRSALVAGAVVVSFGLGGAALAAGGGDRAQTVSRVQHYWAAGPSMQYDGDAGGTGEVQPYRFVTASDATSYDAVVTVSFEYRTGGKGRWSTDLDLRTAGAPRSLTTAPRLFRLADAVRGTSTTVRFLVRDLPAATAYQVAPRVYIDHHGYHSEIAAGKVLVSVELAPSS